MATRGRLTAAAALMGVACGSSQTESAPPAPRPGVTTSARSAPGDAPTVSARPSALPTAPPAVPSADPMAAPALAKANLRPLASSRFLSRRDLEVFNDVCQLVETKKEVGCRCCPSASGLDCGDLEEGPRTSIEHVFYGAFTKKGAREAYATGESYPCGNLSGWGVDWFFRQEAVAWRILSTSENAHHLLHGTVWHLDDGRDVMLVHDVISKLMFESIAVVRFDEDGQQHREELVGWTYPACHNMPMGHFNALVTYVGANVYDFDKDGKRDVVVSLDVQRGFADAKSCRGETSPFERAEKKRHVIPLLFDGTALFPEAKAKAAFDKATAIVNEHGEAFGR